MPDYNFLNLSPPEFEELTRDLLQKHFDLYLESFTSGRDSGIDFRHSFTPKNKLIVQCKRYQDFNSLYNKLKEELPKLDTLEPKRYVLSTSVGLTPNQKGNIVKLLAPYIKSSSDIFGKDDLNNLLGRFPEIERSHFKLWLSSTNILERIIQSKIYNQSSFEDEKVKETVRLYVENESYYKALEIINDKKYVIISGIPGIGKTTLARILVYYFLANGFDEFIFLSDSINEGYELYKENTKQIFLFDDFLGRNFLDKKLSTNEEQRIIRFIEKISKSKDKVLILTTREYILTQAKQRYDIFETPALEFAKCVIDLSQYTKIVRAKILYNHLFFAEIGQDHLADILEKRTYEKIIDHRNYNPRIIETITHPDIWQNINAGEFSNKFIDFLENPESVWKHAYENQISRFSQCVLANLMTAGTPILLDDLKQLIQNFAKTNSNKYEISYSEIEFKKSIRELENTFISINKDSINRFAISYQNPSVQDFLVNYFKELPDYIDDLIDSAIYFNQLFEVFAVESPRVLVDSLSPFERFLHNKNRIVLTGKNKEAFLEKIERDFNYLNSSLIRRVSVKGSENTQWHKTNYSDYEKINELIRNQLIQEESKFRQFVVTRFQQIIQPEDLDGDDFEAYIEALDKFKDDCLFEKSEIIKLFSTNIYFLEELEVFERFERLFPDEFRSFVTTDEDFQSKIIGLVDDEVSNSDDFSFQQLQEKIGRISTVGEKFGIDCSEAIDKFDDLINHYEHPRHDDYDWDGETRGNSSRIQDESRTISDMFDSLRSETDVSDN